MTKEQFVDTYYTMAVKAGQKFGLNPVIIMAQAAQESGWGSSYGAKTRHNFFGIISAGSTNDFWNGAKSQSTESGLWFRVYKTDQDSFYDFARLISSKYPTAAKLSNDIAAYAKAIAYSPYIDEKNGDNRPIYEKNIKTFGLYIEAILLKKK